jgi:hypothetical protein
MRVAIVALGPSWHDYVHLTEAAGGRHALFDQTWVINSFGNVLDHDMVWHMDDIRVQEARAAAGNTKIANMLAWLKKHPGPIMTSRAYEDYPGTVEYPLEAVINGTGNAYFNSTPAYAVAYAIFKGATSITLAGIDFTWPNAHEAESGRACVEYWLGRAAQRGIEVHAVASSTLFDAREPHKRFYGYDTRDVKLDIVDGKAKVSFTDKQAPTAEEIEQRYDHGLRVVA